MLRSESDAAIFLHDPTSAEPTRCTACPPGARRYTCSAQVFSSRSRWTYRPIGTSRSTSSFQPVRDCRAVSPRAANRLRTGMSGWRPVDNKSDVLYRARTSEDGQYEIEPLPPGDYRLRADEDISRTITIAGDAVLNIDIPLVAAVRSRRGARAALCRLSVRTCMSEAAHPRRPASAATSRPTTSVKFTLTGIEPGEIVLMVYKPGYEMHREKIAYSSPITNKTITLRKSAGVEVRVKPGSRRFPRGFTLTQSFPGNDYVVDLWMPLDRDGLCHVPGALAGTTFQIGRFSGEPIVFEDWDGQPFELP